MSHHAPWRFVIVWTLILVTTTAQAQVPSGPAIDPNGIIYNVQGPQQRLELVVNSSRILTMEQKIPTAQVGNRDILDLTALSPTQIQVFAKKAGVTQINLWDERNQIKTVDVVVYGDARELKLVLEAQFPRASLTVTPLANSVIIGGFVDRPDLVNRIVRIAEDYHPNIINNITVGGVQQVLLDVKVMEVSRTKLREIGVDMAYFTGTDFAVSNISGLINGFTSASHQATFANQTFAIGVTDADSSFFGVLRFLKTEGVAKIVADPKIMTVSGRPARFLQGGEFPVLVPQSLGTVSVEYRSYGTEVDFVPIVLGNGLIRLELRPRVSEPDPALSVTINGTVVPALTTREVDTGVEMRAGQTLAIAGLVQTRTVSSTQKVPLLGEMPYLGVFFRRTSCRQNEVETLILVTPHLVDAMDCHEVPQCGPGMRTTVPDDHELYLKGYIEVPKCCAPDGGVPQAGPVLGPEQPPMAMPADGGVRYYHGNMPGGGMRPDDLPPGAVLRSTEEVVPPQRPQTPLPPPQAPQPPMARQNPPQAPKASMMAPKQATAQVHGPQQFHGPQPSPVRRATQPAAKAEPSVNNPNQRSNPPDQRMRTASLPASSAPSFIGPTGYDLD